MAVGCDTRLAVDFAGGVAVAVVAAVLTVVGEAGMLPAPPVVVPELIAVDMVAEVELVVVIAVATSASGTEVSRSGIGSLGEELVVSGALFATAVLLAAVAVAMVVVSAW